MTSAAVTSSEAITSVKLAVTPFTDPEAITSTALRSPVKVKLETPERLVVFTVVKLAVVPFT